VRFHTFSHPEDHSVRLLIKKLGWKMPQDVFRKEMEYLGIYAQGVFVAAVWVQ